MPRPRLAVWVFVLVLSLGHSDHTPDPQPVVMPLPPAPKYALEEVTLTAYSSEASQTDASPFITASGTRTRKGVIALSRDLLVKYSYGTKARILSHDCPLKLEYELVVEDTMHPRKRRQVDIWMPSRQQALRWGRCTGWVQFE